MSVIVDFSFFQTWSIIRSSLIGLPDLENMGTAVWISLISCIEADINVISYLLPVNGSHLWFLHYPHICSLRSSLVVSPDLENMGTAVGISLLSCIETELRLISFCQPPSLILISGFIRQCFWWCHWKVYPRKHRDRPELCFYHVG